MIKNASPPAVHLEGGEARLGEKHLIVVHFTIIEEPPFDGMEPLPEESSRRNAELVLTNGWLFSYLTLLVLWGDLFPVL